MIQIQIMQVHIFGFLQAMLAHKTLAVPEVSLKGMCVKRIAFMSSMPDLGSFMMRGHEMASGFRMFVGASAEVMSTQVFLQKHYSTHHFDVIVIVKNWNCRALFIKARKAARIVLYDTIDNYFRIPASIDGLIVNNNAQKTLYREAGVITPILVLPHHNANFNKIRSVRVASEQNTSYLNVCVVGPHPEDEQLYLLSKNYVINYAPPTPRLSQPFLASRRYSEYLSKQDFNVVWGYHTDAEFCFKPPTRFIMATSTGVPTIAQPTQSLVEVVPDYPLFINSSSDLETTLRLASKKERSPRISQAVQLGFKVVKKHSLRNVVWSLNGFAGQLLCNEDFETKFQERVPILSRCVASNFFSKISVCDTPEKIACEPNALGWARMHVQCKGVHLIWTMFCVMFAACTLMFVAQCLKRCS